MSDELAPKGVVAENTELANHFIEVFRRVSDRALAFFAEWLGLKPETLADARAILENGTAYRRYPRRKPGGGWRRISEPAESLKTIQRALLHNVWSQLPVHYASYAGRRVRSAVDAVRLHSAEGRAFFKADLKSAYPSVGREKLEPIVRLPLVTHLGRIAPHLTDDERTALSELCLEFCLNSNELAQGSPASLHLMNVARLPLDCAIADYLRSQPGKYVYTAYVDDLVISRADAPEIPERVREAIINLITDHGFAVNRSKRSRKVEYFPEEGSARRPVLMGLIPQPDGRATISAKNRRRFRAALHEILKKPEATDADRSTAAGIMGYLLMVYGDGKLPSDVRKLYEQCQERFGAPSKEAGAGYPDIEKLLGSETNPKKRRRRKKGAAQDESAAV